MDLSVSALLKDCPSSHKLAVLLRIHDYQQDRLAYLTEHKLNFIENGYEDVWDARWLDHQTILHEVQRLFQEDYLLILIAQLPPLS